MLEVLTYKKLKNKLTKQVRQQQVLSKQDEDFIRKSIESVSARGSAWSSSILKGLQKRKRSSQIATPTTEELAAVKNDGGGTMTPHTQEQDLANILQSLNLAVQKKTAFSLSDETKALVKEFMQILKDIQAGAPHAYDDLTSFLQRSNGQLNSLFESIPGFLKSLISTLPFPLARKLDKKSSKDVSVDMLKDLAKPGVITGLLKNIMTVLRTRFPAFVGSNALLSLGVFVLLFGVWYCYKRGREERIKLDTANSQEILVEGAKPQAGDTVDHGDGDTGATSPGAVSPGLPATSVLKNETLAMKPVTDDAPRQVESEPIPPAESKNGNS